MCNCDSVQMKGAETFSGIAAKSPIGKSAKSVLLRAGLEKRVTVGLLPAIQFLTKNCEGALFCFTTEAPPGDSATHMQEVLLQAYCVENDIYVVKVDSSCKIRKILQCYGGRATDFSCVLVHAPFADPFVDQELDLDSLSDAERDLIGFIEDNWQKNQHPVIKLPEK